MEKKIEVKKISIIVPIYNVSNYIRVCLESLVNQTYENLEIILVNDGTKDDSVNRIIDIIENDYRVKLYNKENGGLSDARNFGLTKTTGDYIYFIDSDDYIEHSTIEKLVYSAESTNSCITKMNFNKIYHDDAYNVVRIIPNKDNKKNGIVRDGINALNNMIKTKNFNPMVWLYLYKSDFIKGNNFKFKENIYHEDELWTPKVILKANRVVEINFRGYNYVQRPGSIMSSNNKIKRYNDSKNNIFELEKYYENYNDTHILRDYLSRQYLSIRHIYEGSKKQYIQQLDKKFLQRNIYFKTTKIKYLLNIYFYPIYKLLK